MPASFPSTVGSEASDKHTSVTKNDREVTAMDTDVHQADVLPVANVLPQNDGFFLLGVLNKSHLTKLLQT